MAAADLDALFSIQQDIEANQVAVTNPRSREEFDLHWQQSMDDPTLFVRAILVDQSFAGIVSRYKADGTDEIGYWLDKQWWGRGVTSEAVRLFLQEEKQRPLFAKVAATNLASLKVLQKNGFVFVRQYLAPATKRFPECQEVVCRLD